MTLLIVIVIIAFTSSIGWPSLVANSSQSIFASSRMIFSCDFLPTPKFFIICKANRRCLRHSSPFPHNIPTVEAILIRISNYQIVIKNFEIYQLIFFFRINAFDADIAGIKKLRLESPSSHVGTRIFLTKGPGVTLLTWERIPANIRICGKVRKQWWKEKITFSLFRIKWFFIWINLCALHPMMLCDKFIEILYFHYFWIISPWKR